MSYGAALTLFAAREPKQPAIVFEGRTVARGEFDLRTNLLARAFADAGVGEGDFVTIGLPNGIDFLETAFAVWKLGAVPQPISSRLPDAERIAILERARPKLIVGPNPYEVDARLSDAALPDLVRPRWSSQRLRQLPPTILRSISAPCVPPRSI